MKKILSFLMLLLMGLDSALAQSVIIGDTEITEGVHNMYGGTIIYQSGILSMKDVTIDKTMWVFGTVAVVVEGKCTINVEDGNGIEIASRSSVSFVSATSSDALTVKALNDAIRVYDRTTLNIGNMEQVLTMNLNGGVHAIFCDGASSKLYITKAYVNATRGTSKDVISSFERLELVECWCLHNNIVNGEIISDEFQNVYIGFVREVYDLKIGDKDVTDFNSIDIIGNGTVTYDNETKTLKMNKSHYNIIKAIESGIQGLTIIMQDKDIHLTGGLHATADLTLTTTIDESVLTITNTYGSAIINEGCNICIDGGEHVLGLVLKGEHNGIKGISTAEGDATLTVRNAKMEISPSSDGAIVGQASTDLSNETVTTPYRALVKDGNLVDRDFNLCKGAVTMIPGKQYPIWFNGRPVTEFNADNIHYVDECVAYDAKSKTLTVRDLIYSYGDKEYPLIDSDVDGLRIVFKSFNKLGSPCPEGVIRSTGNFSLEVEESAICDIISTDGPAILNEACTASIRGYGIPYLKGTAGIMGKCTKRGDAYLQLGSVTIGETLKGAIVGQKEISMTGVAVRDPYYLYVKDGALVGDDGKPYSDKVEFVPAVTYKIWLAGRQVNEFNFNNILHNPASSARYYPDDKILVLKDVKLETNDREVLHSAEEGLTIELNGQNDLTSTAEDGRGLYLQHHTSIVSPSKSATTISASQTGIETARGVSLSIGDDKSDDMKLAIVAGEYGILGTKSYMDNPLSISKAAVSIASTSKAAVSGFSDISLSGVEIMQDGVAIREGNVVDSKGQLYSGKLNIEKMEKYGVWLCGHRATSFNCDDILGNGEAKYDPDKSILTLKGFIGYADGNLLETDGPVTLHGDGPVQLVCTDGCCIYDLSDGLVIESMDLTCMSTYETIYIEGDGDLCIKYSNVTLTSEESNALSLCDNGLELNYTTLNVKGNGQERTIDSCIDLKLDACAITSDNYYDSSSHNFFNSLSGEYETGDIIFTPQGEVPDAIANLTANSRDAKIYDLQGRRITASQAKHGLYILDGKKVVR